MCSAERDYRHREVMRKRWQKSAEGIIGLIKGAEGLNLLLGVELKFSVL